MRSFGRAARAGLVICAATALASCDGDEEAGASGVTGGSSSGTGASGGSAGSISTGGSGGSASGSGGSASGSGGAAASGGSASGSGGSGGSTDASGGSAGSSAGAGGTGPSDAGSDAEPADPCADAPFCEKFDGYPSVTTISGGQRFGPWRAALQNGASMNLDGTHKLSGSSALHVHIDATVTAGGRLFAEGSQPIFTNRPTHVYGRMMMYIDPNGTSVHWTFFGVNGNAESSSPVTGRNASYILSSLPRQGMNTYSFVYGLQAQGSDQFRDCSSQSRTSMPSAWACIAFEMDSVARKLRMYKDGAVDPILSVDERGTGCVAPTPVTTPWYGPAISQLFVGAWSFHPMNAPLDVWIDDVVVDTKPVNCPPP